MEPDGFAIIHNRMTDTLYFGPFRTLSEARAWQQENGIGFIVSLYLTIDWNRPGGGS